MCYMLNLVSYYIYSWGELLKIIKTFCYKDALKRYLEHWKIYISFVLYVSVSFCISFIVISFLPTNSYTHDELFVKVKIYVSFVLYVSVSYCISFIVFSTFPINIPTINLLRKWLSERSFATKIK